ncbi:MAG: hypothetical protein DWQ47_03325 [Acidobacteria bacterium]|nr:MAG: hypothetical protein DWQ32_06875 [Acidobacteriota bacterium]REK01434.1 MAG: hypothetical protein DWQ38_03310 [Acidobacteriota bacterium]REK14390.1 MAG: hypothetical protein DWQ43_12565 [Acidobacteriota bacterium]REK45105.1 MAG: hypothetical protein DWQ47_03325 [Acidobacteriota bacterium]
MSRIPIASDNDLIFFLPQTPSTIKGFKANTGDLLWSTEIGGSLSPGITYTGDVLRTPGIVDSGDGSRSIRFYSIDTQTGIYKNSSEIPFPSDRLAAFGEGKAAILGFAGDLLITDSQKTVPGLRLSGDGFIGISESEGEFYAWTKRAIYPIDSEYPGSTSQKLEIEETASGSFLRSGDLLFVGTKEGSVYALDIKDGSVLWRSRTGGEIDGLSMDREDLIVISRDNFVYKLSRNSGQRIWKRKLAGRIVGSVELNEDYSAFLSFGSNDVHVIRMNDGRVVNAFEVDNAAFFVSPPLKVAGILIVPYDRGVLGIARKSTCGKEKDGP